MRRVDSIQGKERFRDEFGPPDTDGEDAKQVPRPAEFKALFHGTNTGDHFRIGIRLTRGSVCASFACLLCSPLHLSCLGTQWHALDQTGDAGLACSICIELSPVIMRGWQGRKPSRYE